MERGGMTVYQEHIIHSLQIISASKREKGGNSNQPV